MVHKAAIVGRPSQNRKNWGGRGLESGRPGFVLPWEKMDGQCHADDDSGLLNCPRGKTRQDPEASGGKGGPGGRLSRAGWRPRRVSARRERSGGWSGAEAPSSLGQALRSAPGAHRISSCPRTPTAWPRLGSKWGQRADSGCKPRAAQGGARRGDNSSHYSKRRPEAGLPPAGGTALTG